MGGVSRKRGGWRAVPRKPRPPPGAYRHAAYAALIGSFREPRPLSCSRAGFGIAAIFVDVSAPQGFWGKTSVESPGSVVVSARDFLAHSASTRRRHGFSGPGAGAPSASLGCGPGLGDGR